MISAYSCITVGLFPNF